MKNLITLVTLIFFTLNFTGCEFIGDIFKAGVWVGVILIIGIVAVIIFLVKIFSKKG